MPISDLRIVLRLGMPMIPAFLASTLSLAQPSKPVITLDPPEGRIFMNETLAPGEASFAGAPPNFRSFESAQVGEIANLQRLTLHFAETAKLTKITASKDFRVEQGSSCVEGNVYEANGSCMLLVRFTPQGPGARLGKVTIAHTASAEPFSIGLGGNGYAPVLSFTPALITTVAGTYPSNVGLLKGAQSLAVDGGDTLYIADTANNLVRYIDSSATIQTLASGYTDPLGIATDTFGEVYFDLQGSNHLYEIYDYGPVIQIDGAGAGACTAAAPCNVSSEALASPGLLASDPYNHIFFPEGHSGAAILTAQPPPAKLAFLYNPFAYQETPTAPIGVDASDDLYSLWANGDECEIVRQALYDAENSNVNFIKIAGGHACGFSGDGGQAGNAEISSRIGQIIFDLAGNLYFTDYGNQRVRRIDYVTGQINTIAGTGTAGYTGDGYASTAAALASPTGLGVDSQGQVYIISQTTAAGPAQVIRKLGPNGALSLGSQLKGTAGTAKTVTLSNTGNSALTFTRAYLTGGNAVADFTIDVNTTSCILTAGATLASGQSCKVGIIFKPAAAGSRTTILIFLDNTVTNSNTVQLSGTGTLPAATFAITSPAASTTVTAGTAVKFAVSVTSTSTTKPTGTVKFTLDGTATGSPVTIAAGVASVNVTSSVAGTHTLAATYSGDANYAAAGPLSRTFTVKAAAAAKIPATVKLSASANPSISCKSVVFSTLVAGASGATPTGTVVLKDGDKVLATASLNKGSAALAASALSIGTHIVTATYSGDSVHASSTSTAVKEVVTPSVSCSSLLPKPIARAPGSWPLE
jgi:hypothetical protein